MARPRALDKTRQFWAILRKNFILQIRGRKGLLGIGGVAGLILQLLLPVSFFFVMYLPKYYIKPFHHDETLGYPPVRLESVSWAEPYDGPATFRSHRGRAALILTPDTPEVRGLGLVLARTLACPRDRSMRTCPLASLPSSFHCMFMPLCSVYDNRRAGVIDTDSGGATGGGGLLLDWPRGDEGLEEGGSADGAHVPVDGSEAGGEFRTVADGGDGVAAWPFWMTNGGGSGSDDGGGGDDSDGGLLRRRWSRRRQRHLLLEPGAVHGRGQAADGGDAATAARGGVAATAAAAAAPPAPDPCADFSVCMSTPSCYEHVLRNQISFMSNEEAARHATVTSNQQWDAVVHFPQAAAAAAAAAEPAAAAAADPASTAAGSSGSSSSSSRSDGGGSTSTTSSLRSSPSASVSELLGSVVVGMNHTDVPPTKFLLDLFEVVPTQGNGLALYRRYWFFANLQLAINRAVLGIHVAANTPPRQPPVPAASPAPEPSPPSPPPQGSTPPPGPASRIQDDVVDGHGRRRRLYDDGRGESVGSPYDFAVPANVEVSYKAFPWPAVTEDLGAAAAAVFFQLLLVYAFLPPTRAVVGDIVREKELRLREGMRVLGLSEPSYWLSWGLTHWLLLALSGLLCTAAGTYPFANSSAGIMLVFFWLYAAALVSYGYCLSTLFSSSRVAGTVVQLLYALSTVPGFVLPAVYQYGSWTWYAACLAPPSAATLYAAALVNWEKVAEGIRPSTLWTPITQTNGFCAATVLWMLALDVVLYAVLTWYLDKVLPKSYGQRLPWWFVFDRRYWAQRSGSGSGSGPAGSWRRLWRRLPLMRALGRPAGSSDAAPLLEPVPDSQAVDSYDDEALESGLPPPAVEARGLVKVFRNLTGDSKLAVDHLDLRIDSGRITALLGHNGAGKTTTIHILTGMLQPTAGSATVNGFDVATQMDQIRASLGICPQFDILWPDLTVCEHLELYGAIKGYRRDELREAAASAAAKVGLTPKLHSRAGDLSGGQRRKLSVAIAFMGNPAVVFLDEPTSGMDPYSRRFTWDVIRQHRSEAAIVLTTHSMEEADLLGDRVVILARGRVAAEGTGMELKATYGVGYNLTLVMNVQQQQQQQQAEHGQDQGRQDPAKEREQPVPADERDGSSNTTADHSQMAVAPPPAFSSGGGTAATASPPNPSYPEAPSAEAAAVMAVVRRYVPSADLLSAAGAEIVVRLPREAAASFPALLRELDGPVGRQQLGVSSYGLSLTTLEEVFLSITAAAEQQAEEEGGGGRGGGGAATANGSVPSEPAAGPRASGGGAAATRTSAATGSGEVTLAATATPTAASSAAAGVASSAAAPPPPPPPVHPAPLSGWRLYGQQLRALFSKRALCARRDRLAVLTQLAVPLALVYLALWISSLQVREPSQPPLELSRRTALLGRPLAWSASPDARNASEGCSRGPSSSRSCLAALLAGHPGGARAIDSGANACYRGDPRARIQSRLLEDYLLRRWYTGGGPVYDALHVTGLPPPAALVDAASTWPPPAPSPAAPPPALSFVLTTNQSAVSALPAALADAMTAAWSYINLGLAGAADAASARGGSPRAPPTIFSAVSWPLPTLSVEPVARIRQSASSLMLVLCLVLASSVLSASFVVFIVREQDNNSKHLQLVSGAPSTAYWAANYSWDLISYSLSAAGLLALVASYRLPQYSGRRLAAVAGLLGGFGPAGISLTYLLHFPFRDEMRALQRLNTAYFLTGYLGFVATWIADLIEALVQPAGALPAWNRAAKELLRIASPHYCFARGMYDVQATYDTGIPFIRPGKPFDWDVFGSPMAHMAIQTLVYGSLAVLYDAGWFTVAYAYGQDAVRGALRWLGRRRRARPATGRDGDDGTTRLLALEEGVPLATAVEGGGNGGLPFSDGGLHRSGGGGPGGPGGGEEDDEDDDVAAEKRAVIEGRRAQCQVLLMGVRKTYSQGLFRPAVAAVRGLWVGVPAGECFGLLGVNGAGKTSTFRMLTGEVMPDEGDARVGGCSVRTQLAAARRQLGYCPQFEALPGAMTGREVAAMYARLRGVPEPNVGPLVSYLLRRLGLEAAADSPCGGYSGGMKRKLGVAVALVGDPRVCALDEPSTGMDPGARRGLWNCLQTEVIRAGRTVILTSHSMEECEALCTRLTIMVSGRLRCLGTVQHLKSRFGGGYILEIKTLPRRASAASLSVSGAVDLPATGAVQPPSRPLELSAAVVAAARSAAAAHSGPSAAAPSRGAVSDTGAALAAWVASVCPGATLSFVDQNRYTFSIPRGEEGGGGGAGGVARELDLAALFAAVESQRGALGIVDYCLTQTTLEQLFVTMAGAAAAAAAGGGADGVSG